MNDSVDMNTFDHTLNIQQKQNTVWKSASSLVTYSALPGRQLVI